MPVFKNDLGNVRNPSISLGIGLAVATLNYVIYTHGMPTQADTRATKEGDQHLETVRTQNLWTAAGITSLVSLLAKDPTIFVIGGLTLVGLDWTTRYNIYSNPITGAVRKAGFDLPEGPSGVPSGAVESNVDYLAAVP